MVRPLSFASRVFRPAILALIVSLAGVLITDVAAQPLASTIAGRVADADGRPIAGVDVVVTETGSGGYSTTLRTDEAGAYRLVAPPGPCAIRFSRGPTGHTVRTILLASETMRLDVVLPAGERAPWHRLARLQPAATFVVDEALLADLPLDRPDPGAAVLELTPGIARGSAFGAAAEHGTPRRVDGLDLTDPLDGRAWASFILPAATTAMVRAGVGAQERDGSGAVLDVVTRAGGLARHGLLDVLGGGRGWSRDALAETLRAANPHLADRDRVGRHVRLAAVLGGPLTERVGFGVAVEHADDARADGRAGVMRAPRAHGRLIWASGQQAVNLVGFADRRTITGEVPRAVRAAAPGLENERRTHTIAGRATWEGPLGNRLRLSSWVDVLRGARSTRPSSEAPGRLDDVTGVVSDSLGLIGEDTRTRTTAGGALGWTSTRFGGHDLRVGVDVERTQVRQQSAFTGGEFFHDLAGRPDTVDVWDGDDRRVTLGRDAVYATDTWTPASRLAIVAGLRAARLHGGAYAATAIQPRVGMTLAIDREARLVTRASAGIVADPLLATHVDRTVGGATPVVTFQLRPDGRRVEIGRTDPVIAAVADGIRHPQARELTAGAEARLSRTIQIGGALFARRFLHAVDTTYPDARWVPQARPGLAGVPLTIYRWANRSSAAVPTIVNVDGFAYQGVNGQPLATASAGRDYAGVTAHAQLRLPRDRGSVVVAVTSARNRGTLDDTFESGLGRSDRFASPTAALTDTDGRATLTPDLAITVFGTTRLPWLPIRASVIYQRRSGSRYAAQRTFGAASLDVPFDAAGRTALLEPRGTRALPAIDEVSVRLASRLPIGKRRPVELYADIYNVLDRQTVTAVETQAPAGVSSGVPLAFEAPIDVQRPLRVVAGGRLTF